MAFEYKFLVEQEIADFVFNCIFESIKMNDAFKDANLKADSIILPNPDPSSRWKEFASIDKTEDGLFMSTILNKQDRDAIIQSISKVLDGNGYNFDIEEE